MKKKDYRNICILLSIVVMFIIVLLCFGRVFGSEIDWANQHVVFPDYFRKLFYKTHCLLPSISLNIGMGQSIYYLSYYGLLSPIVLFSYILPFISMQSYMLIASITSLAVSVILFYKWCLSKYNSKIALITSLLFLLNSTFFYHFHRHIMFVIYMPFLILALIGIDKYFNNRKILPLIISTFLIIMTNYYFGAYSCIVIFIYTIYILLKSKKFDFLKLIKVVYFEIIAVLLSSLLLIPTIYALFNGRIETLSSSISLIKLFSPIYNITYTFYYSYYSWGLTFIYVIAILFGFVSKDKSRMFISTILSLIILFPIFSYILNGGMYVDGKCYLPFLPIALLLISDFINDVVEQKINIKDYLKYIITIAVFLLVCSINNMLVILLIIDTLITLIVFNNSDKIKNKYLIFIPAILISLISFICSSTNDDYLRIKTFNNIDNKKYYELSNYIDNEDIYRTSIEDNKKYTINKVYDLNNLRTSIYSSLENINYHNQVRNVIQSETLNRDNFVLSQTSSILFNIYSGSKYLITSNKPLIGYEEVKTIDGTTIYKNDDVLPIIYASNNIMSKREFDTLKYPYQLDALLNYVIVDEEVEDVYKSNVEKVELDYLISDLDNLEYFYDSNHYIIKADKNATLKIKINPINNKVLIIKFKMNKYRNGFACSSNISINGINNSLSCKDWKYNNKNETFEYVLSSNEIIDELLIKFSAAEYDISDIETYTIDYEVLKSLNSKIKKINFNINNNNITADINIDSDSYVKTTIPYEEKGYKLLIDGKEEELIKVDDTYLGFKVTEGKHNIELTYSIPYLKEGILLSLFGIFILIITLIIKRIYKEEMMNKVINLYKKYEEIINYVIIGGLTTVVSLAIYYGLTLTIMNPNNAIELQITNIVSWIVSVTFAYFTNRRFVFKKKDKANIKEAGEFFASRITTLILDIVLMYIFVTLLHLNDKIIKLIVQVVIIILNYILSKFLVFNKKKQI